ncbi:hypothetical protein [Flavobacterium sp. MK4S-17]|uniref:hypothetical protein n=1 Tax=Flavobacterium sp. MK4S-17 TaxID=2543737 RepID=UPI00135693D1|nr:hypothetical protein [Flavobacterium sp. MK4S-17]
MKLTRKHIYAAILSLIVCTIIGIAVQYFFDIEIYRWLIIGALVPLAIIASTKKDTN